MPGKLIPFGYLVHGSETRLDHLMEDEQTIIVDIRYSPHSRRPEWRQTFLENRYGDHQRSRAGRYHYLGELGNVNYRSDGPITLSKPGRGIAILRVLLVRYNVLLLCACQRYETCHRRTVVELLQEQMPDIEIVLEGAQIAPVAEQETLWKAR